MSKKSKKTATKRKPRRKGFLRSVRKKRSGSRKGGRRVLKRAFPNLLKSFLLIIIVFITLYIAYRGVEWIIGIRASKTELEEQLSMVVGFESVPIFPGSEYVFKHSFDDPVVENFIASGRSIYRIPLNTDIQEVFDFYQEELPERGWEHIKFVERTQKDQMYGDYWENSQKHIGLRIYDRVNDIWFERLSVTDANEGLSRLASQEVERELVLASTEGTDLLPDFPWSLKVPVEYVNSYYATDEGELQGVKFSSITDGREFILEPIISSTDSFPDQALELFVEVLNSRDDDRGDWAILNSTFNENGQLEAVLTVKGDRATAVILNNERSAYYYGLFFDGENDPFMKFLMNNLRQKSDSVDIDFSDE